MARDYIEGQRTVRLPHPEGSGVSGGEREFALVKGRRWTRVFEYLSNGQLTARAFVDEATREVREAAGAKQVGRMMPAASAAFYLALFELPELVTPPAWNLPAVESLRTKLADAIEAKDADRDTVTVELTLLDVQVILIGLVDLKPAAAEKAVA